MNNFGTLRDCEQALLNILYWEQCYCRAAHNSILDPREHHNAVLMS
jgi:hypothetical protein